MVEIMVAIGLVGIAIYMMTQFFSRSLEQSKVVSDLADLEDLRSGIRIMRDCTTTSPSLPASCSTSPVVTTPVRVLRHDGTELIKIPDGTYTRLHNYHVKAECIDPIGTISIQAQPLNGGAWQDLFTNPPFICKI